MRITDWMAKAKCRGAALEQFFSEDESAPKSVVIAKYCGRCPVRVDCLTYALRHEVEHEAKPSGIWGGATPNQRIKMKRIIVSGKQSVEQVVHQFVRSAYKGLYTFTIELKDSGGSIFYRERCNVVKLTTAVKRAYTLVGMRRGRRRRALVIVRDSVTGSVLHRSMWERDVERSQEATCQR